ncbi:MAG: hypothetical protein SGCHY_001166 [Lobulomycetales sp.]
MRLWCRPLPRWRVQIVLRRRRAPRATDLAALQKLEIKRVVEMLGHPVSLQESSTDTSYPEGRVPETRVRYAQDQSRASNASKDHSSLAELLNSSGFHEFQLLFLLVQSEKPQMPIPPLVQCALDQLLDQMLSNLILTPEYVKALRFSLITIVCPFQSKSLTAFLLSLTEHSETEAIFDLIRDVCAHSPRAEVQDLVDRVLDRVNEYPEASINVCLLDLCLQIVTRDGQPIPDIVARLQRIDRFSCIASCLLMRVYQVRNSS